MRKLLCSLIAISVLISGLWIMPERVMAAIDVTYYANNGKSISKNITAYGNILSLAEIKQEPGVISSYWENGNLVFKYWNTADDGSGDTYYPGATPTPTSLNLYAIWGDAAKGSSYSLTFGNNGNGESGPSGSVSRQSFSESFAEGSEFKLDAIPDEGYSFDHWEISLENPEYYFDDAAKAQAYLTVPDAETTVTAIFYKEGSGIAIEAVDEELPEIMWGLYPPEIDSSVKTSGVSFKEANAGEWDTSVDTVFSVPQGVKIRAVRFTDVLNFTDSPDNIKNDAVVLNDGNPSSNADAGMKLTDSALTLSGQLLRAGSRAAFTAHFYVSIEPGFEGDIPITLGGGGLEEEQSVSAAAAIAPISVETVGTTTQIVYGSFDTADITITENKAGAIRKDGSRSHAAAESEVHTDAFVISIENILFSSSDKLKVLVDDGDLKISRYDVKNGELHITVNTASTKPSTIKVTGCVATVDRSLAQGTYELRAGGAAIIGNYCAKPEPDPAAFDRSYGAVYPGYVSVTTGGGSENAALKQQVSVSIGSNTLKVGEEIIEMDVAPYIQNGKTMVPARFLALALGVRSDEIIWDAINKTMTIKMNDRAIQFTVGSDIMTINGTPERIEPAMTIEGDRAFIPFRALGDAVGVGVSWEESTRTAVFNPEK